MQKTKTESFEKYCLNCGSASLELYQGGIMGWQFKCKECGWIGNPLEKKIIGGRK